MGNQHSIMSGRPVTRSLPRRLFLTEDEIKRLAPYFLSADGGDDINTQLNTLRRTTRDRMPPRGVKVKVKPYEQLVRERLIPIGDHIMRVVKGLPNWALLEMQLWKYVGQLHWPDETHNLPHLRAREIYYNAMYHKKAGKANQDAESGTDYGQPSDFQRGRHPLQENSPLTRADSINIHKDRLAAANEVIIKMRTGPGAAENKIKIEIKPSPGLRYAVTSNRGSSPPARRRRLNKRDKSSPCPKGKSIDDFSADQIKKFVQTAYRLCMARGRYGDELSENIANINTYPEAEAVMMLQAMDTPDGERLINKAIDDRETEEAIRIQEIPEKELARKISRTASNDRPPSYADTMMDWACGVGFNERRLYISGDQTTGTDLSEKLRSAEEQMSKYQNMLDMWKNRLDGALKAEEMKRDSAVDVGEVREEKGDKNAYENAKGV